MIKTRVVNVREADTAEGRALRKVTLLLPPDLLERAMKVSGQGLTSTIRQGLEAVAAAGVYDEVLQLRSKIEFPVNFLEESRREKSGKA